MRTWKHWTHDEDELLRAAAQRGYPDLRWIALKLSRSYSTVRWRASRLSALYVTRGRERAPAARPSPTGRTCSYWQFAIRGDRRAVYCSPECRALAGGHLSRLRAALPAGRRVPVVRRGREAGDVATTAVGALQDDRPAASAGSLAAGGWKTKSEKGGWG